MVVMGVGIGEAGRSKHDVQSWPNPLYRDEDWLNETEVPCSIIATHKVIPDRVE